MDFFDFMFSSFVWLLAFAGLDVGVSRKDALEERIERTWSKGEAISFLLRLPAS
jgi:hypothetical protein